MQLDLFDQVAVTWPEIFAWCERVARIDPRSERAWRYMQLWDVAGKVARAKLAREFSDSFLQAVARWEKETPLPGVPAGRGKEKL